MTGQAAFVRTIHVAGFQAHVTIPKVTRGDVASVCVEWTPRVPRMDAEFSADQRTTYQRLLSEAIASAF